MCSNKQCPHNNVRGRGKSKTANGCDIFPGVSCLKCLKFRP